MDNEVIEQKLGSLRRCLQRIQEKCPLSAESLVRDFDLQAIVTLNLTRAIQLCADIGAYLIADKDTPPPATMGQTFDALANLGLINTDFAIRIKKAVGFRNIAFPNYVPINWQIVHVIATSQLNNFKDLAQAVIWKYEF